MKIQMTKQEVEELSVVFGLINQHKIIAESLQLQFNNLLLNTVFQRNKVSEEQLSSVKINLQEGFILIEDQKDTKKPK